jgi:hypothetical protein
MRTKITIDDCLLREGKQGPHPLSLSKRRGGARPGVNVADGARLRDLMDFPDLPWREPVSAS